MTQNVFVNDCWQTLYDFSNLRVGDRVIFLDDIFTVENISANNIQLTREPKKVKKDENR